MHHILKLGIVGIVLFITISSIAGMASIFKTIAIPIGGLMFFIECAKYGGVAYGYKNWYELTQRFKVTLVVFVTALSLLTSVGIFGYLGSSFQNSHNRAQKVELDLSSLTVEKQRLESRIDEIDKQVAELPKEFVNGRIKLLQAFAEERKDSAQRLKEVNSRLSVSKVESVDSLDDLGPVVYLAGVFGASVEGVVSWIIIFWSVTLDPMAIYLTVLLNRQKVSVAEKKVEEVVKVPKIEDDKKVNGEEETLGWNFK